MQTSGTKSLYISCMVGIFYVTEIDIWAGFEPVSSTEKIIWADYEQPLRAVFLCFHGQKNRFFFGGGHCALNGVLRGHCLGIKMPQ